MKYLPIGSVILLKGATHPIMIYGRVQRIANSKEVKDYLGCPYPEGYVGDRANIFFDTSDIGKIVHMAPVSRDEEKIQEALSKR